MKSSAALKEPGRGGRGLRDLRLQVVMMQVGVRSLEVHHINEHKRDGSDN